MRCKLIAFGLVCMCLLCLSMGITAAVLSSDLDGENWNYCREITVKDNSGTTLNDYQVLIKLNLGNFDFTKAKFDGSDIRFTDANKNELSYWIEEWNAESGNARIWVKVPSIPMDGEAMITMRYGNENANSVSDGVATFVWFDDFEGHALGATPTGWKVLRPTMGSCTITKGEQKSGTQSLKFIDVSASGSPCAYVSFPAQTGNFIFEADYQIEEVNLVTSSYLSDCISHCQSGANIYFQNDYIRYYDGSNIHQNVLAYNLNQWYSIRQDIDITKRSVDIWVDGIKRISNGRLVGISKFMDRFYLDDSNSLGTGLGTGIMYVDNPRIRLYTPREPTITISAEFSGPKDSTLTLTKSVSPSTIQEGETTIVAIKVENIGLQEIEAVKVTDTIPTGFTVIGGLNSANFAAIKPGDYRIFKYTLQAIGSGKFTSDPATVIYRDSDGNSYSGVSNSVIIYVSGEDQIGADSDGDGWSDEEEKERGTNPYSVDSDFDGLQDTEDPDPTVPAQKMKIPGFEAIFAIAELLAIAYIMLRSRG